MHSLTIDPKHFDSFDNEQHIEDGRSVFLKAI